MLGRRGFKKVAIVIAVACGIITGFSIVQQYRYARANWWGASYPIVISQSIFWGHSGLCLFLSRRQRCGGSGLVRSCQESSGINTLKFDCF